jgi:hypothetical protein
MENTAIQKIRIDALQWMQKFQFTENGPIYDKAALLKGEEEIGYFDTEGFPRFAPKNTLVIPGEKDPLLNS